MTKRPIFLTALVSVLLVTAAFSQPANRALSVADIEELLRAGVTPRRMVTLIEERGINFRVTGEIRERLEQAGADAAVMVALVRAGLEFAKRLEEERRVEEEKKRVEDERRKIEEERRKVAEDKHKVEEEKLKIEEAKQREEEKKKIDKVEGEKKEQVGAEMAVVPAGEFWMGSNDGRENEKPRRRVYLDGFYIDRYEVTNSQYEMFMKATGHEAPQFWSDSSSNEPQQPVVGVSWHDAEAYCKWAGKRLPTEAEWEKAARGTDGRNYPWGNQKPDSSKANYYLWWVFFTRTDPVGSYPNGVSPYGIHDMAGNVWEWVADWYDESYYRLAPERNPRGPNSGLYRVFRGGAWLIYPWDLRSSYRYAEAPTYRHYYLGFRCAR